MSRDQWRRDFARQDLARHSFTLLELMEAAGDAAAMRIEEELPLVVAEHEIDDEYQCRSAVQNTLMGGATKLGYHPETGRLTAACALIHLREALWEAEELQLKMERDAVGAEKPPESP